MADFDKYPALATPAVSDTVLVLDVSDNSVIPAGIVKQTTVGELLASLNLAGSGTVTTVSVTPANGLTGTVSNPASTPAITLATTVAAGLVKSTGTALAAATPGTDFATPASVTAEATRATTAEGVNATAITTETTRATTAEGLAALKAQNLLDLPNAATARTNLGLGTAAVQNSSAFDAAGLAATAQGNAQTFATSAVGTENTRALAAEALLAPKASPAFTGTPTAPTATALTNTTQMATTAYADAAVAVESTRAGTAEALKAPLASPALTGTPTAPTQTAANNSTRLATTAYADLAVGVEATRATGAEGTLTTSVAAKVAKAGDTLTGKLSPTVTVVTFASTVTLPVTTNVMSLTLTANCTINAPATGNDGDLIRVRIIPAGHTVTWGTGWSWGTAGAPTLAGPRDRIVAEFVSSVPVWDSSADLGHT